MLKKFIITTAIIALPTLGNAQSRIAGLFSAIADFNNTILGQVGGNRPLMSILDRFATSGTSTPQNQTNATTSLQPLGYYAPDKSKGYTVGDLPMSNPNTPMTCSNSLSVTGGSMNISNGSVSCSNSSSIASGNTIPFANGNSIGSTYSSTKSGQ